MPASASQLAELQAVDASVNALPYNAACAAHEPSGLWKDKPDGGSFECRDYVLAKENQLRIQGGWSALDLTVVECWIEPEAVPGAPVGSAPERQYHAVLAVEAGGETWILDNRTVNLPPPTIYRWDLSPFAYLWDRRQIPGTDQFARIEAS